MADRKNDLTPKELHFAWCVASGMVLNDSYQEAYNIKLRPSAINMEAHRLMSNPAIRAEIDVLIAESDKALVLASLRHLIDYPELFNRVNVRATELLGKSVVQRLG